MNTLYLNQVAGIQPFQMNDGIVSLTRPGACSEPGLVCYSQVGSRWDLGSQGC